MAEKKKQYPDMTVDQLRDEENEIRTAMFNLRLGNTTKELENTAIIRSTRRELARVLTAIRAKQIEAAAAPAAAGGSAD